MGLGWPPEAPPDGADSSPPAPRSPGSGFTRNLSIPPPCTAMEASNHARGTRAQPSTRVPQTRLQREHRALKLGTAWLAVLSQVVGLQTAPACCFVYVFVAQVDLRRTILPPRSPNCRDPGHAAPGPALSGCKRCRGGRRTRKVTGSAQSHPEKPGVSVLRRRDRHGRVAVLHRRDSGYAVPRARAPHRHSQLRAPYRPLPPARDFRHSATCRPVCAPQDDVCFPLMVL